MGFVYFAFASMFGFAFTTVIMVLVKVYRNPSDEQLDAIVAIGFALTWMVGFFAPFFHSEKAASFDLAVALYGIGFSIFIGVVINGILRVCKMELPMSRDSS